MSITSGFFNSLNGDRRYSTEQMSSLFDGIIGDGVFMAIGNRLKVSASGGMSVVVGSGRAWFNHTWTYNDTDFYIEVPVSELVLDRIDTIVLEVNADEAIRKNTIKLVKGTPATNPVAPTLTNTAFVKQYPLANISVKANVTAINTSDITNLIGTSQCPWVTGVVETVDTDDLVEQWQARFEEIYAELENAIEQTVAGEVVDGSVTMSKLASDVVTEIDGKLSTCVVAVGAKTMSFTVKGAGSSSSNAWRRQMIAVQAWSQGADFANMQMMVDGINGAPYGGSKCFVTVGRNLPVTGIIYSTDGNDTTYTITFKADAMWALGYITYKDGIGMSVVGASDITSGTSMVVDTSAADPIGYAKKVGNPHNLLDNSDFRNPVNQRGRLSYDAYGYTIDRWVINGGSMSVENGYVTNSGGMIQRLPKHTANAVYTFVCKNVDGTIEVLSDTFESNASNNSAQMSIGASSGLPYIHLLPGSYLWVALYEGEYTAETLPEYQPKGYGAELLECQRYAIVLGKSDNPLGYPVVVGTGTAAAADTAFIQCPTPIKMRANPTVIHVGAVELMDKICGNYLPVSDISAYIAQPNNLVWLTVSTTSAIPGDIYSLTCRYGESYILLSADL